MSETSHYSLFSWWSVNRDPCLGSFTLKRQIMKKSRQFQQRHLLREFKAESWNLWRVRKEVSAGDPGAEPGLARTGSHEKTLEEHFRQKQHVHRPELGLQG